MPEKAFIAGCASTELTREEARFFKAHNPWGYILFERNLKSVAQARNLVDQLRECAGREIVPIFIDEEGGRVQRRKPPTWHSYPAGRVFGKIYEVDPQQGKRAAWLSSRLIAHDLNEIGINVNCVPVLDVLTPETSYAIGDRAYSSDPDVVCEVAAQIIAGTMAGGVATVMKHMPGHGRANCDSHFELPRVTAKIHELIECDFLPFKTFNQSSMAMTAHIIFEDIDPDNPATISTRLIEGIIREKIGFSGLLISDDVSMQALSGDYFERSKSIFEAGCEIVLHCNADMEEMVQVAEASPFLEGLTKSRAENALADIRKPDAIDADECRCELQKITDRFVA